MTSRPGSPLSGGRVLMAGLAGAGLGTAVALVLRVVVAHSTAVLNSYAVFWFTVLLVGSGAVAGMALAAVHQLQRNSPEPEYHRPHRLRGGTVHPSAEETPTDR